MSPERNLRVLVVDDHDVVHWGFRLLLTEQPWVERCLTASSVEERIRDAVPGAHRRCLNGAGVLAFRQNNMLQVGSRTFANGLENHIFE